MAVFKAFQTLSIPGTIGEPNEDAAGAASRAAWIVDGATGISGSNVTNEASDAAWLAGQLHNQLTVQGDAPDLPTLEASVAAAFDPFAARLDGGDHLAPSACLGLVTAGPGGHLRGALLGDVTILLPINGQIERWTDERAKPFERLTFATLGEDLGAAISDTTRRQIMSNREKMNHDGGYWVVQPLRPWAKNALSFEARVDPGAMIVLASDGFMRLVDLFGAYSDESLHAALAGGGGEALMQELRERENRPDSMRLHRRVKIHDDATFIVVEAQVQ
jgi:hypothetical protein